MEKKIWCGVCEAACGLVATVEGNEVTKIRPDETHPNSRGFACPKGILFPAVLKDPDRITEPQKRQADGSFAPVSWDEALDDIGNRLNAIIAETGTESIGVGLGNATAFNYGAFMSMFGMASALKTKHFYTAGSVDINNYWVVGQLLYGHNLTTPFPDWPRTDYALLIGTNPLVSHGSMITQGEIRKTLLGITERGGRVVVVDPRRTETAELFEHVPIRPEGDPWLLAAMLHVVLAEGLENRAMIAHQATGIEFVRALVADVDLDRAALECGIERGAIEQMARDFAGAPSASIFIRCGASTGRFATLTKYLVDVLNLVTGNVDRPGGVVFGRPMIDTELLTKIVKANGYDRWRTRVDGIPEVLGTTPFASFAREVTTPGKGRLRALITVSSNFASTSPAANEMEAAIEQLDLFVSLDPYITETSQYADYILPPTLLLEREGFPIFSQAHNAVPNAQWIDKLVDAPEGVRDDWRTLDEICKRIGLVPSAVPGAQLLGKLGIRIPPAIGLDLFMRIGPEGDLFGLRRKGISRKKLMRHDGAIKLGDRSPTGWLRKRIHTKDGRIHCEHQLIADEMRRLAATECTDPEKPLRLFTIRELRSQNSWLHNVPKLMAGGRRCRLRVHPQDAEARQLTDGDEVHVASRWGEITIAVQVTDEVMPGSVGLQQHWGHGGGWRTAVAAGGARYNDLVPNDPELLDVVSGNAWLNGIGVEVTPVPQMGEGISPAREGIGA